MKPRRLALITVLLLPIAVLLLVKPSRLLIAPLLAPHCQQHICTDDASKLTTAVRLYTTAREYLASNSQLHFSEARIIFCSTESCGQRFGVKDRAGYTLGRFGIVIAPRGWTEHYVAHELVHHWTAEQVGILRVLLADKPWLTEGMAYALSGDPRTRLNEPFETYRQQFLDWRREHDNVSLKQALAEEL